MDKKTMVAKSFFRTGDLKKKKVENIRILILLGQSISTRNNTLNFCATIDTDMQTCSCLF